MPRAITGKVLALPDNLDQLAEDLAVRRSLETMDHLVWLQVAWRETPGGRRPMQWVGYVQGAKVAVVTWTLRQRRRSADEGGYTLYVLGRRIGFYDTSDWAREKASMELGDVVDVIVDLFETMAIDYQEFYARHEPWARAVAYGLVALVTWASLTWHETREERSVKARYVLSLPANRARIQRFNTLWSSFHRAR